MVHGHPQLLGNFERLENQVHGSNAFTAAVREWGTKDEPEGHYHFHLCDSVTWKKSKTNY